MYNDIISKLKVGGTALESRETAVFAAKILDDKKAREIKLLDISGLTTIAEFFVICTGGSTTQVKALADNVVEKMSENGAEPLRCEGYKSCEWILLDYGDVVVHIFKEDMRSFYNLDHLWGDAKNIQI